MAGVTTTEPCTYQCRVTDHAILRYLERCHGFNFDDLRKEFRSESKVLSYLVNVHKLDMSVIREVFNPRLLNRIANVGSCRIIRHDCILVVENSAIVTVMAKEVPRSQLVRLKERSNRWRERQAHR